VRVSVTASGMRVPRRSMVKRRATGAAAVLAPRRPDRTEASVVSTEGPRPERRDLASTTGRLFVAARSLDDASLGTMHLAVERVA